MPHNFKWIDINDLAVAQRGATIKTVLGSCVGVLLYCEETGIFGLNHYNCPETGYILNRKLLNEVLEAGGKKIKAVILGGSLKYPLAGGSQNAMMAEMFLESNGIRAGTRDIGGQIGRIVTVEMQAKPNITVCLYEVA